MKNTNKRIKGFAVGILAIITFMVILPSSALAATGASALVAYLPYMELPTGLVNSLLHMMESRFTMGIEEFDEKAFLVKVKEKIAESSTELKTKIEVLERKDAEFKTLKDKLEVLEAKSKDLKDVEEFKTLAKECSDLSLEVKAMKENGIDKKDMKFVDVIEKSLTTQKDDIAAILKKGGKVKLDYKAAGAITSSNFGTGVLQGLRLPGIDPLDRNQQTILPEITIINGGPGSDPFSWVEKVVGEGGAAGVNESAAKPLYDFDYVENKVTAEMTAAIVVVTKQALLRMPMLMSHINEELIAELRETLQTQIITGNAVAPNLNGIKTNATPFQPTTNNKTIAANDYDVIASVASQVVMAHGMPMVIGVSPAKFYELQTLKDANHQYLLPPFMSGMPTSPAGSLIIAGMRVIPMWDLAADEFLGGDLRRYMFNIVDDINIEIGYFDDLWRKNQLAVRAEIFGNGGVKTQHKKKIIKGNFADAKALLDPAVSS